MNFFNFEGGEPLKRMRKTLGTSAKDFALNTRKSLKRVSLGLVNFSLAFTLIASTNPIATAKAADTLPVPEIIEEEVAVDFSIVHIVNTPKETDKTEEVISETKPSPVKVEPVITSATNLYPWGQCTFYVKSIRKDIPNRMGNAYSWFNNAQLKGYGTGHEARIGAIVATREGPYGHVAMVEDVKNGQIIISEMNYKGLGVLSSRAIDLNSNLIVGYIY